MADASETFRDISSLVFGAFPETCSSYDLGAPETHGVRDDGALAKYYHDSDGGFGGFSAVVPEPTLLVLLGLAALFIRRR